MPIPDRDGEHDDDATESGHSTVHEWKENEGMPDERVYSLLHGYILRSHRQDLWLAMANNKLKRDQLLEDLSSTLEGCRSLSILQYELVDAVREIDTMLAARALISMSTSVQAKTPSALEKATPGSRRPSPSFPGEHVPRR
ncbi:hypothetical protein PspLS_05058 [Pyricularia sp. CBS 133598]|nr:hypothetical protein PspLS_05058 [Pyricularia sp. CBS 133598]